MYNFFFFFDKTWINFVFFFVEQKLTMNGRKSIKYCCVWFFSFFLSFYQILIVIINKKKEVLFSHWFIKYDTIHKPQVIKKNLFLVKIVKYGKRSKNMIHLRNKKYFSKIISSSLSSFLFIWKRIIVLNDLLVFTGVQRLKW